MDQNSRFNSVLLVILCPSTIIVTCYICNLKTGPASDEIILKSTCLKQSYIDVVNTWFEIKKSYSLNKHTKICKDLEYPIIEKEEHKFFKIKDRNILVYSAFYERRKEADGPAIRIIGAGYQKAYNNIGAIFCQMWYPDRHLSISVPADYQVIYPSTLHPDMWCSHFIICKLPTNIPGVPYSVTVTSEPCSNAEFHLLVLNRSKPKKSNSFGVCISPIYQRYKNWTTIIEMFEVHKQLGAAEITTYNNHVHETTSEVLNSYIKDTSENVNVYPWKPPYDIAAKMNVFIQRGALNDCMYRMAHKHTFVTIQDLDEVLVPRKAKTWPDLFFTKNMHQPDVGIYMFQHYYFKRNESDKTPYFVTQNSFWRTKEVFPVGKIRCKSLYNSAKAISVDLHYHFKMTPGAKEYLVKPEEGVLHHYRNEPMTIFRTTPSRFEFVEDKYMAIYKSNLHIAYDNRLKQLNMLL